MRISGFILGAAALLSAQDAIAADYFIQLSGVCSTEFVGGKGEGQLASFSGITSVNAVVDQRDSMSQATA
ncbi:MAG: hypothetical protein AAFX94_20975, partial [Myxococcota bacterium]